MLHLLRSIQLDAKSPIIVVFHLNYFNTSRGFQLYKFSIKKHDLIQNYENYFLVTVNRRLNLKKKHDLLLHISLTQHLQPLNTVSSHTLTVSVDFI